VKHIENSDTYIQERRNDDNHKILNK